MRSFEERMAEISRRSEERLKERKKRRSRLLAACIPIVLCAALILPGMLPAGNAADSAGTVKVSGDGVSHCYTAAEDVTEITDLINRIVTVPETGMENEESVEDMSAANREESSEGKGYTVTVTKADGNIRVFTLAGSKLIDRSTMKAYEMSGQESEKLKKALGIPSE